MTGSIFAGPEAAGGQEVSGVRRWPFRPDKADLQVNKHTEAAQHGDDIIRDGFHFKSGTEFHNTCWNPSIMAARRLLSLLVSI